MKRGLLIIVLLLQIGLLTAQDNGRILKIQNKLEVLSVDNAGLTEKLNINIQDATLTNFLIAISKVHKVNMNVAPELQSINIVNNFSNVTVSDLLLFLCKEYALDIDFIGNILSIKKHEAPIEEPKEKEIIANYNSTSDMITLDLKNDLLGRTFRKIMDSTGKNLLFSSGMENERLTIYLKDVPFDKAMENMALSNNLIYSKSRDGFYLFEKEVGVGQNSASATATNNGQRPTRRRSSNFFFKVLDTEEKLLEVDFVNTPIESIINDIGNDLNINIFTATPLSNTGTATFKAKKVTFDELLEKLFENSQIAGGIDTGNNSSTGQRTTNSNGSRFTFKKENNVYYFGTLDQLTVKEVMIIPMMHRSIEILQDPSGGTSRSVGRNLSSSYSGSDFGSTFGTSSNFGNQQGFGNQQNPNRFSNTSTSLNAQRNIANSDNASSILDIVPEELKRGLQISTDFEQNTFVVNGPSQQVKRFEAFVKRIDKPVPVVLIEVMILEISRSATVETGISWGIGDDAVKTKGGLFPTTDFTLGAETVNKVLGGIDGFDSFKVVPEFFAQIKAMEANGNLKIRSTPKLATLNGHRATFSNGSTTYFRITQSFTTGVQNPIISESVNYVPIDAELGLSIKPLVSGDGKVTLDIFVIQSDFNNDRIDDEAPPGIDSREFSSIISVDDQDMVVLGGLEEKVKNDSGTGVPLLARIPVIKWLFSSRKREDSRKKLTVLIKPTVIN
ncbi:type II secretion system protein GspD [Sungkyunkwania multivorans]|uniref:Type II secretion system protein GspD n=1 Tax=Sungkyunkwania multivorans TaxID=1173618 RepID=A0ABW3CYQ4_9FLAO